MNLDRIGHKTLLHALDFAHQQPLYAFQSAMSYPCLFIHDISQLKALLVEDLVKVCAFYDLEWGFFRNN